MAGIGFELRRVFQSDKPSHKICGYSYALLISAGPMLISILLLLILHGLMRLAAVTVRERELISALITYCFIFAMIISSGPAIAATRFISDRLYLKSHKDIIASLHGLLAFSCLTSIMFALLLFSRLEISFMVKILAGQLLTELTSLYILMSFISAVKAYKKVAAALAAGSALSIILAGTGLIFHLNPLPAIIAALVAGFGVSLLLLISIIRGSFPAEGSEIFAFRNWLLYMPKLVLCNLLYALALFSHNFVIWLAPENSQQALNGLYFVRSYDIACFLAVLTVLPGSIRFLVIVETDFYEKYMDYAEALGSCGTMQQIIVCRRRMTGSLWMNLAGLFRLQAVITILSTLAGTKVVLPFLGIDRQTAAVFSLVCPAFLLVWLTFILVTIILYFDQQSRALRIMLLLWLATTLSTILLLPAGEAFRGVGLLLGSALSAFYALAAMRKMLLDIDYQIYAGKKAAL